MTIKSHSNASSVCDGGTEHYTYDYAGNITSTTDANGGTITYRYNSMGQVHEVIDQEGNGEFLYCDEEGRREMQIDRNGNINRYHYTIDGALSYQRAEDKKGRYPVVNRYMYYPDGSLKEAEGGGITYCYDYTENGLLKRKSTAKKLLLEYAYDQNGNLSVLTDGKGKSVYYSYDGLNRLQQVSEGEGKETILAEYSYNLAGQVEKMHYGNGLQTECRYREDGNLTSLVTITAQGKVLLNFDYAYDGKGNCIQKSGERYQNTYVYDRMNRLVEAAYDGKQERYTYDLAGNRLKKESEQGTEIYHYNVKNQLTHVHNKEGEIKYHYDVQGNLLEEQGSYWKKQYTYDATNHQRSVTIENQKPDKGREYLFQQNQYDAEGLRYEVEENGKIHYFLFDRGELAEESQENSSIRYLRGYQPIALENSKDKEYFVQDEAGSTLFLLDKDHEIQKTYRYDAFGIILKETGSDGELSNRLTYTGQMLDCATGQYYLRARFYHPEIGRFMQEDVYRGDALNLYAYCANNPVMYYDPSGYWILCLNGKLEPTNSNFDKIRNYRNQDISEIDPKYLADPEYVIDMPFVGKKMDNANSQGWLRDSKHFYKELSKTHPELFSDANMQLIAQGNLPQVDDQFLKYFPQYKDYMFELLLHHHIGGSGQVMPIPESLHSGSGGIHNIEKLNGIWGGVDMINADKLQGIKSSTRRTRLWKNVRKK